MYFIGLSMQFSTANDAQYENITKYRNYFSAKYGMENLRGLLFNRTENKIEYVIGLKGHTAPDLESAKKEYPEIKLQNILLPEQGWFSYTESSDFISGFCHTFYKNNTFTYAIESFSQNGSCQIKVTKEYPMLEHLNETEIDEIVALYRSALGTPGCVWTEEYPTREILLEDIRANALFGIKNDDGQIIAAIARDRDDDVDALPFWNKELSPVAELARLVVSNSYKNQGMARILIRQSMKELKKEGFHGVHYLVADKNMCAVRSYRALGFHFAGEVDMYGEHYLCYESRIQ
ncbi:MAG: GNAT family N-acetyltransferase [Muricoprocola sp.]